MWRSFVDRVVIDYQKNLKDRLCHTIYLCTSSGAVPDIRPPSELHRIGGGGKLYFLGRYSLNAQSQVIAGKLKKT
ncbi:hypothetical protein GCM10011430_09560 [Oxalicibacterium solurbis]|uniref:Uncharacterized protein n=1 Tax=Oxalicibacterium solurbis TaxID=69280 RepID=A0A8J3AVN6_9BURK|nr:hypothetical protein GCM10011430_09560 [Oxalicibacterium solurbis]